MNQTNQHRALSFQESVRLACSILPGLAADMKVTQNMRKYQPRDMSGIGRLGVVIPDPILDLMKPYFPDLFQSDQSLRKRAWLKWMKTDDARMFRAGIKL